MCAAGKTGISRQKSASIALGNRTASEERNPFVDMREMHGRVQQVKKDSSNVADTRDDGDDR